jgi:hypothetical protein
MANQYLPGVVQIPSMLLITDMTQNYPLSVEFSVPSTGSNTYIPGMLVRLTVPKTWGMFQANGLTGKILSVSSTTMLLDIDSTYFDSFVDGSSSSAAPASLTPAGSRNLEFSNLTNDVPFQSLNNIGN